MSFFLQCSFFFNVDNLRITNSGDTFILHLILLICYTNKLSVYHYETNMLFAFRKKEAKPKYQKKCWDTSLLLITSFINNLFKNYFKNFNSIIIFIIIIICFLQISFYDHFCAKFNKYWESKHQMSESLWENFESRCMMSK